MAQTISVHQSFDPRPSLRRKAFRVAAQVERLMHVLTSAHTSDALRVYVLKTLRAIAVAFNGFSQPAHLSAHLVADLRGEDDPSAMEDAPQRPDLHRRPEQ